MIEFCVTTQQKLKTYLSPPGKSGHCMLLFDYITLCKKNRLQSRKKYQEKANYEGIKKLLPGVDWKLTLQRKDVQAQWDTFDDIIKHYVKEYVPSCMVEKKTEIQSINNYFLSILDKNREKT